MAELNDVQHRDAVSSFIEALTPAELERLLELKLAKRNLHGPFLFGTADGSAYWEANLAENAFIKDITKHGRELPGISVLFLTIPVVESELARKVRDARIESVLGPTLKTTYDT